MNRPLTLPPVSVLAPLLLLLPCLVAVPLPSVAEPASIEAAAEHSIYQGKVIGEITIEVADIFTASELPGASLESVYRAANKVKINTKKQVIRQELLFKRGDTYDDFLIKESERNLRTLGYLRNISIVPTLRGDIVDLVVKVQDTWTFIPQLGYSSGTGRQTMSAGVAETNLLGLGKRLELLYREDEARSSLEGVWQDDRVFGTKDRLVGGYFDRSDGERALFSYGRPYRSFVERSSWNVDADVSDTIGRLFERGDERFIYRQDHTDLGARYSFARGNPERRVRRYSVGFGYTEDTFRSATAEDYDDLDLDPADFEARPGLLATDRRWSGPLVGFEQIDPDFVTMNYIDRFERVEDYNLGAVYSLTARLAAEEFGSADDALLMTGNVSRGHRFREDAFIRGELGIASRYEAKSWVNSLLHAEVKYYRVLGAWSVGSMFLGKHTLAASWYLDYGDDLDRDRELLTGGDNAIRGYEAKTFTGDKRMVFNVEDRFHIADDVLKLLSVGGAVFFDGGGSTTSHLSSIVTDDFYSDVGIGLRLGFPRSTNGGVVRIDLAFPLRDGHDGSAAFEPRLIFAAGQLFGSRLRSEVLGTEKSNVAVGFDR